MKIIYLADDETEFDNADDCQEYERRQRDLQKGSEIIKGFSYGGEEISFSDNNFMTNVYSLYLKNQDAENIFINECTGFNLSSEGINGSGIYIWNDTFEDGPIDEWVKIDELINIYQKKINTLEWCKKLFVEE